MNRTSTPNDYVRILDAETERAVLATVLLDSSVLPQVIALFQPTDFELPQNRTMFRALASLDERGEAVDALSVWNELQRAPSAMNFTSLAEMSALTYGVPRVTSKGMEQAANRLRDLSLRRRLIHLCRDVISRAEEGDEPVAQTLGYMETTADLMRGEQRDARGFRSFDDMSGEMADVYACYRKGITDAVATGYEGLDRLLAGGGFKGGELIVVSAPTSGGKSAFAMGLARSVAKTQGAVGIISREMSSRSLFERAHSAVAGVPLWQIRPGLHESEFITLLNSLDAMSALPVHVDSQTATINEIRSRVRDLVRTKDAKLIIVDYLQLVRFGNGSMNRVQEVSEVSMRLKAMALEFNVPVVALSQLNRDYIKAGEEPQLHHLKEAGQIEQDSDVVIFVDMEKPEAGRSARAAKFRIAKQRNGPLGEQAMVYDGEFLTFYGA